MGEGRKTWQGGAQHRGKELMWQVASAVLAQNDSIPLFRMCVT